MFMKLRRNLEDYIFEDQSSTPHFLNSSQITNGYRWFVNNSDKVKNIRFLDKINVVVNQKKIKQIVLDPKSAVCLVEENADNYYIAITNGEVQVIG